VLVAACNGCATDRNAAAGRETFGAPGDVYCVAIVVDQGKKKNRAPGMTSFRSLGIGHVASARRAAHA